MVKGSKEGGLPKPTSNFGGSFGVCDLEYMLDDLKEGQGDLMTSALGGEGSPFLETKCLSLERCFVIHNPYIF